MEEDIHVVSAKRQLKSFGTFLEDHSNSLNNLVNNHNSYDNCRSQAPSTIPNRHFNRPISIDYSSNREYITKFKLIDSDNKFFNKTILTFSYLCEESDKIVKDGENLQQKFLYVDENLYSFPTNPGEINFDENTVENDTEDCLIKISNSLEFLCNIQFVINGALQLLNSILQQLTMYHSFERKSWGFQYNLQFNEVFNSLENLMIILLTFDEILMKSNFHKFWPSFKKTIIQSFQQENFSDKRYNEIEINGLITVLNELEMLFTGNIFKTFLENIYRSKELSQTTKGLQLLSTCSSDYIKTQLNTIRKFPTNISEFNETKVLIALNAFIIMHHQLLGQIDHKFFKQLIEFNIKYNGITLLGSILWYPEIFLKKHAETLMVHYEKYLQESIKMRQIYLQSKVQNLNQLVRNYFVEISLWTLKINASIEKGVYDLKIEQFKLLCLQFLQGIQYAGQLNNLVKSITNLHAILRIPMTKSTLTSICKLIELLKLIQLTLSNDMESISKIMKYIKQCSQYKCLHIIVSTKKKLTSDHLNDEIVDTISALRIIEKSLNGPPTRARLFIINLLVHSQNLKKMLTINDMEKLIKNLKRSKILSEFQIYLNRVCDISFLYWHQSLVKSYLKPIIKHNVELNSFYHLIHASDDCCQILNQFNLNNVRSRDAFNKSNYDQVKQEIVSKLCGNIETFLRIEVHSNLQLEKLNPFEQTNNYDSRALINGCLILLNGHYVSLSYHIENYLSNMFYNLTTIHLHDWKAYEKMRQLAKYKHKLVPIEDYLPTQTIEQGIDALEIMRNIHIFVTQYNYNMNNQYFVEKSSNNKYLNTIGINHVANSIRVHGSGIINTTVNFSYQFLRQKFYTFSQFLYDQQIHSRLMKEHRYLWESKRIDSNDKKMIKSTIGADQLIYSYERADDFNKEIRKLGSMDDGLTYMDKFRQLITQVGNTMGYIRMIRSGNVHANYTASVYLPNFNLNLNFEQNCAENNLPEITLKAATILEANIKNYGKYYSEEDTDFFKLLMNAFQPFFQNPNNMHLRNFFLIIPPLMLNYVDYILNARERVSKREKIDAVLFDDGFAMGLACTLKLCNQFSDFESLHWFKAVKRKFAADFKRKNYEMEMNKNSKDESLLQTLALVEKRMNAKFREFSLLNDSLYSAKIFFQ